MRGVLPRETAKAVGQINRLARGDGKDLLLAVVAPHGAEVRLVELVDVLRHAVVQAKIAGIRGEYDDRVGEARMDRLEIGALANGRWVQRGLDPHLLARGHVRHLHHARRRVERVLGDEDHGPRVGDVAVGVRERQVRRVAVALQVDVACDQRRAGC